VKASSLLAHKHVVLFHPTGDGGDPAARRTWSRGKAKAKMRIQVSLQELLFLLVSSVTIRNTVIIVNVINSDLGRL